MTDETLSTLITNINLINSTQQYTYINTCLDILNIRFTSFDELNIENHYNDREQYILKIIKTTEKLLTEQQKEIFYSSIKEYYIFFTSNNKQKIEILNNYINQNRIFNNYGNVSYEIITLLTKINNDDFLTDFLTKYNEQISSDYKAELISIINNDTLKLNYLNEFIQEPENLAIIIKSINDDQIKLTVYNKYQDIIKEDLKYINLLSTLKSDTLKIDYILNSINHKNNRSYERLILNLNKEESIYKIWSQVSLKYKIILLYKINNTKTKIEYFIKLNQEIKEYLFSNTDIERITDILIDLPLDIQKQIIYNCPNIKFKYTTLIRNIKDEELIIHILKTNGTPRISKIIRTEMLLSSETILKNIALFLDQEEVKNKEEIIPLISYLYQTNNDIVYTILWPILTPKYINTLGLDKINVLASFRELENTILKFDDNQYQAFYLCLNNYIKENPNTDWNFVAYQLIKELHFSKVDNKDITHFITDFNVININTLTKILIHGDQYDIKSLDDIINYENYLRKKNDKDIKSHNLNVKRNAIFIKAFGLSDYQNLLRGFRDQLINGMQRIYNLYSKDIELIESNELKELFKFVKSVIENDNEIELEEIYNSLKEGYIDSYKLEAQLKNELLKLYNKELLQLNNLTINQDGLYEAGTDFSIIATSIGAYVKNSPENYHTDWNRPSLASQHFCTNFIRNDMLGTAPIPHLMYGFTHMEPYSLILSGATDIYSSGASFISKAFQDEIYYAPDTQINQTAYNQKHKYNEMDFKRFQNGKRKLPDYILVFRKNGTIPNLDEAKKASLQWNNLPIVVIDIDLCLKEEKNRLLALINQFYQLPTLEIYNQIKTKILNNRITEPTFAENINLNELKEMINSDSISNSLPIKK